MREAQLVRQLDPVAAPDAEARGRPLADAVQRQDRGLLERRREEGAGGVRLVVVGEDVACRGTRRRSPRSSSRGMRSFVSSQSGIALRSDAKPLGANAR